MKVKFYIRDHRSTGNFRCISVAYIEQIPRVNDFVLLKDGLSARQVEQVSWNIYKNEVHIRVHGFDDENLYPEITE